MGDILDPQPVRNITVGDLIIQLADGTIGTQLLAIDSSGRVTVKLTDGSGNSISSTSNALNVYEASAGPVSAGTAAGKSDLVGGQYNSTLPTLTTGQQAAIQVDSSGRLLVNIAASSGTIAVTQSTSPWVTSDLADGSVGGGTAGTKSMLAGGQYNSTLPTLTAAQQAALQVDSSGRLLVGSIASALPAGANVIGSVGIQVAGAAVSSSNPVNVQDLADGPVSAGTAATKSMLVGATYNSTLPTLTTGQQASVQVDSSGRLLVGSIASALPAGANVIGSVGIQVAGAAVSNANPVPVTIANTPAGTLVNKYNTTANLAVNGVANHVYTITTGKTFTGRHFWASSSIRIRADVQTSPDGSTYSTYWTGFNTASQPNIDINLDTFMIQDSGTGSTVRIQITNEDSTGKVADVFSTISGSEN